MTAPVRIVAPVGGASYKPAVQARAEIAHYLNDFDMRSEGMPKRLDPALVERVLLEVLEAGPPRPIEALRMVELADFYATYGVVPRWLEILDRGEKDAKGAHTTGHFVIGVGALGDAAERARGQAHYHRLVASRYAPKMFALLVRCFDAYTPGETRGLLAGRMDQVIVALRKRAAAGEDSQGWSEAGDALAALEDLRNVTLGRAEGAAQIKQAVLAETDPAARFDQLARIYAGFDLRFHEFTKPWATRLILRAARARAQAETAAAFRAIEDDPGASLAEPPLRRKARAVYAVAFLGAEPTPEEKAVSDPMIQRIERLSLD